MSGSSNITGDESIIFADNASFDGTERGGKLTTNGELWVGSTILPHVKKGSITSPMGTLSIGYSSPNITMDVTAGGNVVQRFALQTGTTPVGPLLGEVTFSGSVVSAGTNPVRTDGTGANTMVLEVQTSQAVSVSDATKIGLSNFDSSAFSVDSNGFTTWTLDWKNSVHAASRSALTATYANGSAGIGATLTNSGALAALVLDGVTISTIGQRVLIKDQASTFQNGIYTLTTAGTGAVAWVLTRSTDYNRVFQIGPGNIVPVRNGTIQANQSWIEASVSPVNIGTDAITFGQFTFPPSSLTQFHLLVAGANSTIGQISGTGNSGQILQSGGASADPAWSTATYPATAGTTGNVLTSDGTNWVSSAAAGGSVLVATGTLTSSQIKAINSSPIALVAAQGAGKAIIPLQLVVKLNYGSNVFVAGSGQQIRLCYGTSIIATAVSNSIITASSNRMGYSNAFSYTDNAASSTQNVALNFYTTDSAITGNASNDSTITWELLYIVVTL